mmetsp:Transcript_36354/g.109089  ORF Transcript_36354/g.109089 Transcript_36354/m.109089 type:complete len:288 (+) Transcript_36354:194-1057(+)
MIATLSSMSMPFQFLAAENIDPRVHSIVQYGTKNTHRKSLPHVLPSVVGSVLARVLPLHLAQFQRPQSLDPVPPHDLPVHLIPDPPGSPIQARHPSVPPERARILLHPVREQQRRPPLQIDHHVPTGLFVVVADDGRRVVQSPRRSGRAEEARRRGVVHVRASLLVTGPPLRRLAAHGHAAQVQGRMDGGGPVVVLVLVLVVLLLGAIVELDPHSHALVLYAHLGAILGERSLVLLVLVLVVSVGRERHRVADGVRVPHAHDPLRSAKVPGRHSIRPVLVGKNLGHE